MDLGSLANKAAKLDSRGQQQRKYMSFVQDLALLATAWGHVFLAPYTKVEESFNLHAVHDILMYGIRPGAVQNVSNSVYGSLLFLNLLLSSMTTRYSPGRSQGRLLEVYFLLGRPHPSLRLPLLWALSIRKVTSK